jgi:hypothetical protein
MSEINEGNKIIFQNFILGATSAMILKTSKAPFERIKLL